MKHWMLRISTFLLIIGLFVGCTSPENNIEGTNGQNVEEEVQNNNEVLSSENENNEEIVTILISKDHGDEIIADKEIEIEEGAILMDVLKENFSIEEDNGFVTSIEGEEQDIDANKFWLYTA